VTAHGACGVAWLARADGISSRLRPEIVPQAAVGARPRDARVLVQRYAVTRAAGAPGRRSRVPEGHIAEHRVVAADVGRRDPAWVSGKGVVHRCRRGTHPTHADEHVPRRACGWQQGHGLNVVPRKRGVPPSTAIGTGGSGIRGPPVRVAETRPHWRRRRAGARGVDQKL